VRTAWRVARLQCRVHGGAEPVARLRGARYAAGVLGQELRGAAVVLAPPDDAARVVVLAGGAGEEPVVERGDGRAERVSCLGSAGDALRALGEQAAFADLRGVAGAGELYPADGTGACLAVDGVAGRADVQRPDDAADAGFVVRRRERAAEPRVRRRLPRYG